jgi:lactate dehydrogenase-like 2-hydroxyacid dehydrogenase
MTSQVATTYEKREVTQAHNHMVIGAMKMDKLAYYTAGFLPYYRQMDEEGRYKSVVNMIDMAMDGQQLLSTAWPLTKQSHDVINKQFIDGYKMKVREIEIDGI